MGWESGGKVSKIYWGSKLLSIDDYCDFSNNFIENTIFECF